MFLNPQIKHSLAQALQQMPSGTLRSNSYCRRREYKYKRKCKYDSKYEYKHKHKHK